MNNLNKLKYLLFLNLFLIIGCQGPLDPNIPPVADAGPDFTTNENLTGIILDGGGSFDEDGNDLTYQWTILATIGVTATLSNPTSVTPALYLSGFDAPGNAISIQLVVNDGRDDSLPDTVVINHD